MYLVEAVEGPVGGGEGGVDGAPQLQGARPDLQGRLQHLDHNMDQGGFSQFLSIHLREITA